MEEEYQDDIADQIEDNQEYQESMQDNLDLTYPQMKEQHNQYAWFWKIVQRKDSTKVANLSTQELGGFLMPVREAQRFASLCGTFDQPLLNNFFKAEGERTLATSMSKKGWFVDTSISTKKFTSRARESSGTQFQNGKPAWKLFSRDKTPMPPEGQ